MARPVYDILQGPDGDLLISGGDLVVGESTQQHQQELIVAKKGQLRHAPQVGVDAESWLMDDELESLEFRHQVAGEFERDGMVIEELKITAHGKINIKANYE